MTQQTTQRSATLDVYKSILIFLVLLGHSIANFGGGNVFQSGSFSWDPIFQLLYSFHMPLFMGISGWLFASTIRKYSMMEVITKRLWQIIPCYLFWCVINLLFHAYHQDTPLSSSQIFRGFVDPYWFVTTLLFYSILVAVVHQIAQARQAWVFASILPIGFVIGYIPLIGYGLEEFWFNYPFFIGAYLMAYNQDFTKRLTGFFLERKKVIAIVALVAFALLFWGYSREMIIYVSRYSLRGSAFGIGMQLYYDIYRFVIALVGCILFISTFACLPSNQFQSSYWKPLIWVGRNTLGIYMIQEIMFSHIIRYIPFPPADNSYLWHVLCSFVVLGVCVVIIKLLRITPIGKYVV